jgi:hypothetical protein
MVHGTFASDGQDAGNGGGRIDRRHVAVLAGLLVAVVAVQPFRIGHLLIERADFASARVARGRRQGMAGCAQLRRADVLRMLRLEAARGATHDLLEAGCNFVGPVFGVDVVRARWVDDKIAVEAVGLPPPRFRGTPFR